MAKKSFKDNNPALAFISTQEAEIEQQEQEAQRTPIAHTMAFATNNLEYLQLISRIEGVSMTEYVNRLIEADKEARKEIIEEAKKLLRGASK